MNYILLSIHILVCISLIGIVLIQGGKGAEVGAAFGAGASNTIFGASGGQSFIGKMTAGLEVFDWVRDTNRKLAEDALSAEQAAAALAAWAREDSVLGIAEVEQGAVPDEIAELVEARAIAKKARDFAKADAIREQLRSKGWTVEDSPKGPKVKKL